MRARFRLLLPLPAGIVLETVRKQKFILRPAMIQGAESVSMGDAGMNEVLELPERIVRVPFLAEHDRAPGRIRRENVGEAHAHGIARLEHVVWKREQFLLWRRPHVRDESLVDHTDRDNACANVGDEDASFRKFRNDANIVAQRFVFEGQNDSTQEKKAQQRSKQKDQARSLSHPQKISGKGND